MRQRKKPRTSAHATSPHAASGQGKAHLVDVLAARLAEQRHKARVLHAQDLHHAAPCGLHVQQRLRAVIERHRVAPLASGRPSALAPQLLYSCNIRTHEQQRALGAMVTGAAYVTMLSEARPVGPCTACEHAAHMMRVQTTATARTAAVAKLSTGTLSAVYGGTAGCAPSAAAADAAIGA